MSINGEIVWIVPFCICVVATVAGFLIGFSFGKSAARRDRSTYSTKNTTVVRLLSDLRIRPVVRWAAAGIRNVYGDRISIDRHEWSPMLCKAVLAAAEVPAMKVRYKDTSVIAYASQFNICSINEVLTGDDSVSIEDLDVFVNGQWKDMRQAFKDRDVVPNNENTGFAVPRDEEAKRRGYNL